MGGCLGGARCGARCARAFSLAQTPPGGTRHHVGLGTRHVSGDGYCSFLGLRAAL